MPRKRRPVRFGCVAAVLVAVALGWFGWTEYQRQLRDHPERFPWTPLRLSDPIGRFTAAKLVGLRQDPAQCRSLLSDDGSHDLAVPPRQSSEPECGFADGMELRPDGPRFATYSGGLVTACPVAAALRIWEEQRVQPAAQRLFGARVVRIEHFGSFSCRRLYGRPDGGWSEHATANAVDIAGFRLSDGTRINVLRDWSGGGDKAAFLRTVRDGACDLFATTLSPDYNAAHRDHLHLDQALRGRTGGGLCR